MLRDDLRVRKYWNRMTATKGTKAKMVLKRSSIVKAQGNGDGRARSGRFAFMYVTTCIIQRCIAEKQATIVCQVNRPNDKFG